MDSSLNHSPPEVEEDDWDTDGFVIPSLTIGDSDLTNTCAPGVTDPKPREPLDGIRGGKDGKCNESTFHRGFHPTEHRTIKEAEKIYLGPHGAPPQAKRQELNAAGRKQRFKQKLREADRRFSGTGRENKVESLQQLVSGNKLRSSMPKSSARDWLDPHCHESQFEKYP